MSVKKETPGKGGAKGMHNGHAYKEDCKCVICKNHRKKLVLGAGENGEVITDEKKLSEFSDAMKKAIPTFETKHTPEQYRIDIIYPGITKDLYKGFLDTEKKELFVTIAARYKKTFQLPELDTDLSGSTIANINDEVLTLLIPRKIPVLSSETINQFPHAIQNEQTVNKETPQADSTKTQEKPQEQPQTTQTKESSNDNSGSNNGTNGNSDNSNNEKTLTGDVTINEVTYSVMKEHGVKLATRYQLKPGFDHNKFINDLANDAIIYFCKNLK